MLAYVLRDNIDGSKLIKDIQDLINSTLKNNNNLTHILKIDIVSIISDDTNIIPKLTHNPNINNLTQS
jgi:hypothetical protein